VLVHYHGRRSEAEQVADRIRARGTDAITAQADLLKPGAAEQLMDTARDRWGRVDVVVANAGVPDPGVNVMHGTDTDFAKVLDVNTRAVYSVLRAAANRLADGGRLINIGSSSTLYPARERALYAASKAAPLVLTTALAAEFAPRGATANSVISGPVDDGFLAGRDPGQLQAPGRAEPVRQARHRGRHRRSRGLRGQRCHPVDHRPADPRQRRRTRLTAVPTRRTE
jgi:3-oxoacyl-[acyl-carrier protein] reductase